MSQLDNICTIRMKKLDGKLIFSSKAQEKLMKIFIQNMEDGQEVEVFYDAMKDDASNTQLAKVHAGLKKLATELGYTLHEIKDIIKENSGLRWKQTSGEYYTKSFADCSKEEINLVLIAMEEAGATVNLSFI